MKLTEYERSRTQLLQEETTKNMKDFQTENEKLIKKLEVCRVIRVIQLLHEVLFLSSAVMNRYTSHIFNKVTIIICSIVNCIHL